METAGINPNTLSFCDKLTNCRTQKIAIITSLVVFILAGSALVFHFHPLGSGAIPPVCAGGAILALIVAAALYKYKQWREKNPITPPAAAESVEPASREVPSVPAPLTQKAAEKNDVVKVEPAAKNTFSNPDFEQAIRDRKPEVVLAIIRSNMTEVESKGDASLKLTIDLALQSPDDPNLKTILSHLIVIAGLKISGETFAKVPEGSELRKYLQKLLDERKMLEPNLRKPTYRSPRG